MKSVYIYELRDEDIDGNYYHFIPPPSEIKFNAEEVLQSMIGLIGKSQELGYFD